jgi:phosphoribosylanthranilate isomerase
MFVKICGTTNLADAELAVELGADALGFIFAPSKRRVTVEQAATITRALPERVHKVGVFTEPDGRSIVRAVHEAGLTAVQLHLPYDAEMIRYLSGAFGLGVKLWQVMGVVVDPEDPIAAKEQLGTRTRIPLSDPRLSVVLLDSVKDGVSGGTGRAFSWNDVPSNLRIQHATIRALLRREGIRVPELAVAGGLTPENVGEAIRTLRPWGVDVVSGVEASPGKKSPDRLRAFMEAVEQASWLRPSGS